MKICRVFALLLALITALAALPTVGASAAEDTPAQAADLPSSYSLVEHNENGTLPPIDNQGSIGSCVGEAVTYMQFSNAVAHYMQEVRGNKDWKPNDGSNYGNRKYLFSPKWTLNYSGAGTQWVYEILVHMGAPTQDRSCFYKTDTNSSQYQMGGRLLTETTSWDVTGDVMQYALGYRLGSYEQIWTRTVGGGQVTTTEEGRAFLDKIKASVLAGNVVVTGGASGKWGYSNSNNVGRLTADGDISKTGEYACFAAQGSAAGGHQVSIVGWDDNATFTRNGVTMKGAFLVANSWGTNWKNAGYQWFMYDSINAKSEFAQQDSSLDQEGRESSLDQFCFTDYHDIVTEQPDLTLTVDVETDDREGVQILLTRQSKKYASNLNPNSISTYQPVLFYYGDFGVKVHEKWDVEAPDYLNYAGEKNGETAKATFTFSYEDLYSNLPEGTVPEDYYWGFDVQVRSGQKAHVGKVSLKDKNLTELYSHEYNRTIDATSGDQTASFKCSSDCFIYTENTTLYRIDPTEGSTNPIPSGGEYSFTVRPGRHMTLRYARVLANGAEILPNASGVYTLRNITESVNLTVVNVMNDGNRDPITPEVYNEDPVENPEFDSTGWEFFEGEYILTIGISDRVMDGDVYAGPSLGTPGYPFHFRLTDKETGISYYMQPRSVYPGQTNLYRLPIVEAGFSPENGKVYSFHVEVIFEGHVLYEGDIENTTANYADDDYRYDNPDPQDQSEHIEPTQKGKSKIDPPGPVHTITYKRNGQTLGTDAFVEGAPIVKRVATTSPDYLALFEEDIPAQMGESDLTATVTGEIVYSKGDINGDGSVGAKDLTRLILRLGDGEAPLDETLADENGDGAITIADVTFLLAKLSASVSIEE